MIKNYLMLINLSDPNAPEHSSILGVIDKISDGSGKPVYFDKHAGAFLLQTSLNASQIYRRFDGILLNDDGCLIIEIGHDWMTFGHDKASAWLNRHLRNN